ncbi:MAG: hypothetical protein OSJ65_00415 [Bacilli bacterium]|nr:hypothetical protein [Bacilli bacterium]
MDQDFYFEESNPRKTKVVIICLVFVFVLVLGILFYARTRYTLNIKKDLKFEVGTVLSNDVRDFVKNKVVDEDDYTMMFSGVQQEDGILNKVGDYTFKIKYKNITKIGHIKVIDTVAPKVEVSDLTVGVDEEFLPDDFVTLCDDYSKPCKVEYVNGDSENLNKKVGSYKLEIRVSDSANNSIKKEVTLNVKEGFNLTKMKEADLNIHHIEPAFDDWKKEMIIKFSKGYDPNEIDESDAYTELMEVSGSDLHNYIDPLYINNLITDSQFIEVYNKYGLIIGYAIRIKLDNGLTLYCKKN